ncbi:hypothetical protein [Paraburkholderia kirstenboschensis]|uniref:MFS transporter n=1 Tax=Paraburkholderia kirstenboschensis TaxID=1245436 RepID=A0ABZ0E7Y5_9BURK|nr:hypothetical protein [Paraburkholderia kirstenboschensis]WOD13375.1 hypothetical protein RW095_04850 [Paraburkholderia kirstenboschensis]
MNESRGIAFAVQLAGIQRATIFFAGLTIAPVLVALSLILRRDDRMIGVTGAVND